MAERPFVVGLTGGIGSGKTTVSDGLARAGATIVDSDVIAHRLTAAGGEAMPLLVEAFGASIRDASGALDRAAMRARAFADAAVRQRLEAILHPLIRAACERAIAAAGGPYAVCVIPLLIESGRWAERVHRVLVVDCLEDTQVERVMRRSGLADSEVRAIMRSQATRAQRLAAADDVLYNDGRAAHELAGDIALLHRHYLRLAAARHGG